MKKNGKLILETTNGGLDILKRYVRLPFELDQTIKFNEDSTFKVFWSEHYGNYVIVINVLGEKLRYNAIWFVKEKFGLTEDETYFKIKKEMGLENNSVEKLNPLKSNNPLGLILNNKNER